jgi:hypothetical protein
VSNATTDGIIGLTYDSGDTPFQVSTSPTTIYYISLHTSMLGGSKLKVTSLSPITGKKIDQYTLSSDAEITTRDHILFAGANTAAPLLAWTDKANKVLKVNIIGTKNVASFNTPGDEVVDKIVLHAPNHINSLPHFLVEYQTAVGHSAEVYHVDLKKSTVSKAYSLPELRSKGTFTTSTQDANVYFTRVTEDEVAVFSSASHGVLLKWLSSRVPRALSVPQFSTRTDSGCSTATTNWLGAVQNSYLARYLQSGQAFPRRKLLLRLWKRRATATWCLLTSTECSDTYKTCSISRPGRRRSPPSNSTPLVSTSSLLSQPSRVALLRLM